VTRTGLFGRPIVSPYANTVSTSTYGRVWAKAREKAFAGEGVGTPLVYAKCIYRQDEAARRRIEAALQDDLAA